MKKRIAVEKILLNQMRQSLIQGHNISHSSQTPPPPPPLNDNQSLHDPMGGGGEGNVKKDGNRNNNGNGDRDGDREDADIDWEEEGTGGSINNTHTVTDKKTVQKPKRLGIFNIIYINIYI